MNTVHVVLAEYTAKIAPGLSVWALWWCILSCILGQHQPVDVPWYQTGADGYLVEESGDIGVRPYQFICTLFGQVVVVSLKVGISQGYISGENDGFA